MQGSSGRLQGVLPEGGGGGGKPHVPGKESLSRSGNVGHPVHSPVPAQSSRDASSPSERAWVPGGQGGEVSGGLWLKQ